jgi:mono/diheme cytochrome c family protein/plastocyanin
MGAWSERIAIVATALILLAFPAAVITYQFVVRPALTDVRTIDVTARIPESGGFTPETIRIAAGEPVRLRFSVPDVTHGIAIGPGLGLDLGHVDPGQVKELRVTFDRPGRYTLYCNAWCSLSHWRMRATILVYDPARPDAMIPADPPDPVIESLATRGVNIDAPHDAPTVPSAPFSVERGAGVVARLGSALPADVVAPAWRRGHSPAEAWRRLVAAGLGPDEAWDAVASLWVSDVEPARAAMAARLFAKNCAACHGERGDGRGPGADALATLGIGRHGGMASSTRPAQFSRARSMLGGASELYYAKVRRGGMGTGMPSWGGIFTPEETWALVDHLWTFVFRPRRGEARLRGPDAIAPRGPGASAGRPRPPGT